MKRTFYAHNRKNLAHKLPGHTLIIAANSLLQSSADVPFPLRQDSSFWYLTGIDEPDLVLIIDCDSGDSTLLHPEQSDYQKEWDGEFSQAEYTAASGIQRFGIDSSLKKLLKDAKKRGKKIGYMPPLPEIVQPYGFYANPARRVLEQKIMDVDSDPVDIRMHVARLRAIKQPVEIDAIQKAIDITDTTLKDVKSRLASFTSEKQIERALTAGFYERGADGNAYEPIVAGGKNAATIHYMKNTDKLNAGSLLLLDVGSNYERYASDISRTWAIGVATDRQKDVYNAALEVQQIAFDMLRPGVLLKEYQKTMEQHADRIQKKIGITLDAYPHGFSHFMGLDVHDAGDYEAPLQEGMVITVEPGIYLKDEGIGVRIEDDVLITKTGIKVLSKDIPKEL